MVSFMVMVRFIVWYTHPPIESAAKSLDGLHAPLQLTARLPARRFFVVLVIQGRLRLDVYLDGAALPSRLGYVCVE